MKLILSEKIQELFHLPVKAATVHGAGTKTGRG
jgi:hypothetical protein